MKKFVDLLAQEKPKEEVPEDILPHADARTIADLFLKGERPSTTGMANPHTLADYERIENLSKQHLRLPKKVKMSTRNKLTELFTLLSPNQKFAFYHLPKSS